MSYTLLLMVGSTSITPSDVFFLIIGSAIITAFSIACLLRLSEASRMK